MKHRMMIVGLGATLSLGFGLSNGFAQHGQCGHEHEGKQAKTAEVLCPVMDEPVNFALSVETDEGPVFFCCNECKRKFAAAPNKYAERAAMQRKALADRPKVQVKCPVSGKPVDDKVTLKGKGTEVFFCCKHCTGKYKEDPEKYKTALANSYTYQTRCPVMGGEISAKASTLLPTGERVYWCCPGCEKRFLKEPAKYAPNLEKQGIRLNLEALERVLDQERSGRRRG